MNYSDERIDYASYLLDKPQETDPEKRSGMYEALRQALQARGVHGHVSAVYYSDGRVKASVNGAYYGVFDSNAGEFFSGFVGD